MKLLLSNYLFFIKLLYFIISLKIKNINLECLINSRNFDKSKLPKEIEDKVERTDKIARQTSVLIFYNLF